MLQSVKQIVFFPSRLERWLIRRRLQNLKFSIISNNCWGGHVYQDCGLPYNSPFVGMFLFADDFLSLVSRFDSIDLMNLLFSNQTRHESAAKHRENNHLEYPIGVLGDGIEIHFLHYHSVPEAETKWKRRCQRLNRDNLFYAYPVG